MGRDTPVYMHSESNKMPEYQISHNVPQAPAHSAGFWSHNYPLHSTFSSSMMHQNLMPSYTTPNMHAFLMGLNNLSLLNYQQSLSVCPRISHPLMQNISALHAAEK